MKTEITPLEKVTFDGVSVPLGADMSAVEAAIGKGEQVGNRFYYFDTNIAIDYDADNRVEFIEFLAGIDGKLHPTIYGVPAFETDADALAELLRDKNGDEIDDFENGYCLSFLNISVGLYREATPESVNEMIDEMKADGIPTDGNEDVAQELRKAHHWATIGIGVKEYYKRYDLIGDIPVDVPLNEEQA